VERVSHTQPASLSREIRDPERYTASSAFDAARRIHPRLTDPDWIQLRSLKQQVERFASKHIRDTSVVIDYGCGAKPYRRIFPARCRYIGVDVVTNPRADIVCSADEQVPLRDGAADFIVSTQVLHLVKDFDFYLGECHRLLKPGGRLFVTTHGTYAWDRATSIDFFRFTISGLTHALERNGFGRVAVTPLVATPSAALNLRQKLISSWLSSRGLSGVAAAFNVVMNLRLALEDRFSPEYAASLAPIALAAVARSRS
jgi:SAM-dependent methyltransferase